MGLFRRTDSSDIHQDRDGVAAIIQFMKNGSPVLTEEQYGTSNCRRASWHANESLSCSCRVQATSRRTRLCNAYFASADRSAYI
ncbi:MAG: hypothetical protein ACI8W7_003591 [Gammaproteobacteria bacterium]|jgi:hypothetical protein